MNLHLLPYENQSFVPKFVETVRNSAHAQNNLLMCYIREMVVSSIVLPFAAPELVLASIKNRSVNRVIFHSLQPEAYSLVKIITRAAPECRVDWIYWGETYDDPPWLYGNRTLSEYLKARGVPGWVSFAMIKTKLAHALLLARTARFRRMTSNHAQYIDTMFHWSRLDYEHIKMLLHCRRLKYQKFFYDVIEYQTVSSNLMQQELECDPAKCLVVGHSTAMRNNHLDVLPAICEYAIRRSKTVVCPLSYGIGSKAYVEKIAKHMSETPGLSYRLCYKFYPAADYFSFLAKCGAYIAPSRGSHGAGNMFGYALSSRIPVTPHGNSTGAFLKTIGVEVAIYQNNSDIVNLLDTVFGTRCQKNRMVVGEYFSLKNQSKYYEDLLAVVKPHS